MSGPDFTPEPEFIQDGHVITLILDRDEVKIADVYCPNTGTTSLCTRRRTFCVVQRFIDAYGIDLNLGKILINGPIEIAWCPIHGIESDLDDEFDTVWIVPIEDPQYRLMIEERNLILGENEELPALESPDEEEDEE